MSGPNMREAYNPFITDFIESRAFKKYNTLYVYISRECSARFRSGGVLVLILFFEFYFFESVVVRILVSLCLAYVREWIRHEVRASRDWRR